MVDRHDRSSACVGHDALAANGLPSRVDTERVRERAREQQDRCGVLEDRVVVELIRPESLTRLRPRSRSSAQDWDGMPYLTSDLLQQARRIIAADAGRRDAQARLLVGLAHGLADRIARRDRGIRRHGRAHPRGDVDGVGGEQSHGDGVIAEAEHRGHLPDGRRTDEFDVRERCSDARRCERGIGVVGGEEKPGLGLHTAESFFALRHHGLDRVLSVDVVAMPYGHPEHGASVPRNDAAEESEHRYLSIAWR